MGRAAARGLARRGYRVLATARRPQDLAALEAEGLEALALELADPASVEEAAREVLARASGELYGVFHNAGYGQPGALEDLSREALRAQLEANLLGAAQLSARLLPALRRRGEGRLVFNGSILGRVALPYRGAYVVSKYALAGLADSLRLELAGSGIHVSLIEPGPVATRFRQHALEAFLREVDPERSPHREAYRSELARLRAEGPVAPGTLPAEAVLAPLLHALESPRPRAR
ncbi:MAG: SDR family NAD(P)-dependent oxidoreductase, partial [Gammaproteobacteria bacterium]